MPERFGDIARFILERSGDAPGVVELSTAEEPSLTESLHQAERREFATDEQVRSIWANHGL